MGIILGKRYWYITEPGALPAIVLECYGCRAIAIDVETTRRRNLPPDLVFNENIFKPGLDPYLSEIRLLQVATMTNIYIIDLWRCPNISMFAPIFMDEYILKIGSNLKFDISMIMCNYGYDFRHVFDVMLASQLLTNGLKEFYQHHKLSDIARRELGVELDKSNQVSDWGAEVLSHDQLHYAALDVDVLHDICLSLSRKMMPKNFIIDTRTGERLNLTNVMKIENDACIATARMELDGIYIDRDVWDAVDAELQARYFDAKAQVLNELGEINLESPAQLKKAFAARGFNLKSTDADTLDALAKTIPLAALISTYRGIAKLLSSYGNGIPDKPRKKHKGVAQPVCMDRIHPITGRVHASYGQLLTDTGRYQCDKFNIQNIPKMDKARFREAVRGQIIGDTRNVVVDADYGQLETRILCSLAKDDNLRSVILNKTTDSHTKTASLMYGVPEDTILFRDPVTGDKVEGPNIWMRNAAKSISFGLAYGRGPKSLSEQLGITYAEARKAIDLYFKTYPHIGAWLADAAYSARINKYALTPLHRIRWIQYDPNDHGQVASAERLGKNTPIQGCNADIIKLAMFRAHCAFPLGGPVKIVTVVHDEIMIECPPELAAEAGRTLQQLMEQAGNEIITNVPIVAEYAIGDNWSVH